MSTWVELEDFVNEDSKEKDTGAVRPGTTKSKRGEPLKDDDLIDTWMGMGSCLSVYTCGKVEPHQLSVFENICFPRLDTNSGDNFKKLQNGSNLWIRILGRFLDFQTFSLTATFRLSFNHRENLFQFKTLPLFLRLCLGLVHVGILFKMMLDTYLVSKNLAANSSDIIAYFDWLNNFCLIGCASSPLYQNWISRQLLEDYLLNLQTNPVMVKINRILDPSRHFWTECWLQIVVFLIIYAGINYGFSFLGAGFGDFATIYKTSGDMIQDVFGPSLGEGVLFEILKYYFILVTFAQGFAIIRQDLASFLFQTPAFCMTKDFMELLETLSENNLNDSDMNKFGLTAEDLITAFYEFRKFERQRDNQICSTNLAMMSAVFGFYPVHSVDVLSTAKNVDVHIRITMAIIFVELYSFLKKGMDTQIQFRRLKKLIGSPKYLMKIPLAQIRSILYDMDNGQLGIKCWFFFTFSTGFCGDVLQQLFTMIMINLQSVGA